MKKTYSKPQIAFESFTLNTNIAAGCELKTKTPSAMQCGYLWDGDMVFITGVAGCIDKQIEDNETNNGFCYDVPSGGDNIFNS